MWSNGGRLLLRSLLAIALTVLALPAGIAGPLPQLQVSDNRRIFVTGKGVPFFYLADTAWELFHRATRGDAEEHLCDRATKGYTAIQAGALPEFGDFGHAEPLRLSAAHR